jgi:hypothetical protein
MREIGRKIFFTGREFTSKRATVNTKASSKAVCSTGKAKSHTKMEMCTKAIFRGARKMDMGFIHGMMGITTTDYGRTTLLRGKERR